MARSLLVAAILVGLYVAAASASEKYPAVKPLQEVFEVRDVARADVSLAIASVFGKPIYRLQCHSVGYTGDPDFDYSGDFECRLSAIDERSAYSTLLTEDAHQSRDWESRGRFFGPNLRGICARLPDFGATRAFELRGMKLTLSVTDPTFDSNGRLRSLKLKVAVHPDASAHREIARPVPFPAGPVSDECKLRKYFVDKRDLINDK